MAGRDEAVWIGLDLGTQGARARVVGAGGRVVGSGSRPLTGRRDGGHHEQDPEDWWGASAAACREALEQSGPRQVGGIATAATSGTILLMDAAGTPLTPGVMYDDARANEQAQRANDAGEAVWRSLGYRMGTTWGLPKLLWLLEHGAAPATGARLAHACDFVNRRLAGDEVATDSSHALKTGYDLLHSSWPAEVMERLKVPESAMPRVVTPGSPLGEVCAAGSRETGIPVGTPVMAGMTDGCAAQIAAGALTEGSWSSALGTTLTVKGASPELVRDPGGVLYCHRSPDGGWLPGGASSAGAGVLATAFPGRDLDHLARQAAEHERTDVLAYPLGSRGERFPFQAPAAEGLMLGRPADDGERFAALLHGLCFLERLCFDYVDLLGAPTGGALRLTGGATRGSYLCQLRADVLGRSLELPESVDPATGMAVLAAAGGRRVADAAAEMVRVRQTVEPRPGRTEPFLERYLGLVAELEERGWVSGGLAGHARARAAT